MDTERIKSKCLLFRKCLNPVLSSLSLSLAPPSLIARYLYLYYTYTQTQKAQDIAQTKNRAMVATLNAELRRSKNQLLTVSATYHGGSYCTSPPPPFHTVAFTFIFIYLMRQPNEPPHPKYMSPSSPSPSLSLPLPLIRMTFPSCIKC